MTPACTQSSGFAIDRARDASSVVGASKVSSADAEDFPKMRRLLARREFTSVQRRSLAARGSHAVVLVHARDEAGPSRLGIVASKRVGGAVERNRAKRLIREWFRRASLPSGLDVVVLAHASAASLTAGELAASLDETFARAWSRSRRKHRESRSE